MNIKNTISVFLFIMFVFNTAYSQIEESDKNIDDLEVEVKEDQSQLKIDQEELKLFKSKLTAFEEAYNNQNTDTVNTLKNDLLYEMQRELMQSELKIKGDKNELKKRKKEYKISKKQTKLSKEDFKISEDDKADEEAYKADKKEEKIDKKRAKDSKKDYKAQKNRLDDQEKIIKKLEDYMFIFSEDSRKDNEKHKELILDFVEIMEEDIEATRNELKE